MGWQTAYTATLGDDSYFSSARNLRIVLPASALSGSGTKIKITVSAPSGYDYELTDMYVGHAAASGDAYDFESSPTQCPFAGDYTYLTVDEDTDEVSDEITFSFDDTKISFLQHICILSIHIQKIRVILHIGKLDLLKVVLPM